MSREFHIGDILSVTTGVLLSPTHMSGVYEILNYMTGDNLFTHQLRRACHECAPTLRDEHPDLAAIKVPDFVDAGDWERWLAEQVTKFGATRPVRPLTAADHTRIGPIEELHLMGLGAKVIPVVIGEPADGPV